jgi:hypothetical protein
VETQSIAIAAVSGKRDVSAGLGRAAIGVSFGNSYNAPSTAGGQQEPVPMRCRKDVVGRRAAVIHNIRTSGVSMNKRIFKAAIGAAMAVASSAAMATDGSFFINGEVAGANANIRNLQNKDNTSTAGAVRAGYLWHSGDYSWGAEAGYVDLGKVSGSDNYAVFNAVGAYDPLHIDIKTQGEMLGGVFKLHYGDYGWFLSGRGGWFHSHTSARVHDQLGLAAVSASRNGDGFYAGFGLGYEFNKHISVSLNYDYFQSRAEGIYNGNFNTGMYGGTFEYRF